MYLIFDSETTGKALDFKAPITNHANWPRLVSLSWELYDEGYNLVNATDMIVRPNGFTIPKEATAIHGISQEQAMMEGFSLPMVLGFFISALEEAQLLIAHNIQFDVNVVGCEFDRMKVPNRLAEIKKACTQQMGTNVCRIPGKYGGYKWPTMEQLHRHLFKEGFSNAHSSAADTAACAKCFFELQRLAQPQPSLPTQ